MHAPTAAARPERTCASPGTWNTERQNALADRIGVTDDFRKSYALNWLAFGPAGHLEALEAALDAADRYAARLDGEPR